MDYTPFDWITPLLGLLSRGADLYITDAPGFSAKQALRLLNENGIKTKWPQATSDGVLVKVNNLKKAIRVLERHGISSY